MVTDPIRPSLLSMFSSVPGLAFPGRAPGSVPRPVAPPTESVQAGREDSVTLSQEALEAAEGKRTEAVQPGSRPGTELQARQTGLGASRPQEALTEEQLKQIQELAQTDREVRAHENAHKAAGGSVTSGGPNFVYQTGPDGRRYAVGGEVPIEATPPSDDPKVRLEHARQVARAALAPADPSGADRSIAAQANREIAEALRDLRIQEFEVQKNGGTGESLEPLVAGENARASLTRESSQDSAEKSETSETVTKPAPSARVQTVLDPILSGKILDLRV